MSMSLELDALLLANQPPHVQYLVSTPEGWRDTPNEVSFAAITHKEKVAVRTMEQIPAILRDNHALNLDQPASPTIYVSPNQLPLLDRMAVIFSRAMARAREQGTNDVPLPGGGVDPSSSANDGWQPEDVMSEAEVASFVTHIRTIRVNFDGRVLWLRRYYRASRPGEDGHHNVAVARLAVGEAVPPFIMPSVRERMGVPREELVLIAEAELDRDGLCIGARWHEE